MFDSLVKNNDIYLNKKDERFIKALIAGDPGRSEYVISKLLKITPLNSSEARMKNPFFSISSLTKGTGWMLTSTLLHAY